MLAKKTILLCVFALLVLAFAIVPACSAYSNSFLAVVCNDECFEIGDKQCADDGYQVCGEDSDGCLVWSSTVNCDSDETCSYGACVEECTSNYEKKCHDGDVYWYDSCGTRESQYKSCNSDEVCADGECIAGEDECESNYAKKCYDGDVYWYDSCGTREEIYADCGTDEYEASYQCSGNIIQQKVNAAVCSAGVCSKSASWKNMTDCAAAGKVCAGGVCSSGDTNPPVIYNLKPSGVFSGANATLSFTTNEAAECRGGYYDVSFDQMMLKFSTSDKLNHSWSVALDGYGWYTFYIRCRDVAGNTNLGSSRISFNYPKPVTQSQPSGSNSAGQSVPAKSSTAVSDTTAPRIVESSLSPAGIVSDSSVEISFSTNEKAVCKFDKIDKNYDLMENQMETDAAGTGHRKTVSLSEPGSYTYYARCKDGAGNVSVAALIKFNYTVPEVKTLTISDTRPFGTVYQKQVALEATVNEPAECRYSLVDAEFGEMTESFSTDDGLQQIAIIGLDDYGDYNYFVKCVSKADSQQNGAVQINFAYKEYENESESVKSDFGSNDAVSADKAAKETAVDCSEVKDGSRDGACDNLQDCVCDPDCPAGQEDADPDCPGRTGSTNSGNNNMVKIAIVVSLAVLGVLFITVAILRRRTE